MRSIRWIILMSLLAAGCAPAASRLPTSQSPRSASPIIPAAPTAAVAAAPTVATALPTRTSTPEVTPVPAGPQALAINNTVWINTEPLPRDQLNGRVVLIDFWTFG